MSRRPRDAILAPQPDRVALECPECGSRNAVTAEQLVEGGGFECRSCPAKLLLQRHWDPADDGRYRWVLVEHPHGPPDEC